MNNRDRNIQIFEEGKRLWETNERLCKSIARSIRTQRFVGAKEEIPFSPSTEGDPARVVVSRKRTLEAAEPYVREGRKTCILNFASATNPGGGVTRGSSAQEECICRSSTLYPCLNTRELWNRFYSPHRKTGNPMIASIRPTYACSGRTQRSRSFCRKKTGGT
ncbi:MAG: TIGR02452 family protein [Oscillospiraceae bacterium]|nr:TIGR02452 family protein [Oscillospiraceae bacterium]